MEEVTKNLFVVLLFIGPIGIVAWIMVIYGWYKHKKEISLLELKYSTLLYQKKSSEVRLGQISENLAPFLKSFKYNPKKAHFLGNPIDYIVFEDDKIVFLEIKSGESKLSDGQKNIKKLIIEGKVEFDQMRIN